MASAIVTKSSPLPRINYTESSITCPRSISPPAGEGTEIVVVAAAAVVVVVDVVWSCWWVGFGMGVI